MKKIVFIIILLGFTATSIGISIAGITEAIPFRNIYKRLKCSIYLFVNEAIYGASEKYSPNQSWIGAKGVINLGNDALNSLTPDSFNGVNVGSMGSNAYTHSETILNSLYQDYKSTQKPVTNPITGAPGFELDILSDTHDEETGFFSDLHYEREFYSKLVYISMSGVNEIAKLFDGSSITLNKAKDGLREIDDFLADLFDYKYDIYDYADMGDKPVDAIVFFVNIFLFVNIIAILILIAGAILSITCKSSIANLLANIAWAIVSIFGIIGFIATALLLPFSVVFIEACDMIEIDSLANNNEFFPGVLWDSISVCLLNDGDLYESHNLDESLDFASKSIGGLNYTYVLYKSSHLEYKTVELLIKNLIEISKEPYRASKEAFPNGNSLEDLQANSKNDLIVWTEDECQSSGKIVLTSGTLTSSGPEACFAIKKFSSPSDDSNIQSRYSLSSDPANKIINLIKYSQDVTQIMTEIKGKVERKLDSPPQTSFINAMDQDAADSKITLLMYRLNSLPLKVQELLEVMSKLSIHLVNGLNCGFMRGAYNRVYISICGEFVQNVTALSVYLGTISCLAVVICVIYVIINRNINKIKAVPAEQEVKAEISDIVTKIDGQKELNFNDKIPN